MAKIKIHVEQKSEYSYTKQLYNSLYFCCCCRNVFIHFYFIKLLFLAIFENLVNSVKSQNFARLLTEFYSEHINWTFVTFLSCISNTEQMSERNGIFWPRDLHIWLEILYSPWNYGKPKMSGTKQRLYLLSMVQSTVTYNAEIWTIKTQNKVSCFWNITKKSWSYKKRQTQECWHQTDTENAWFYSDIEEVIQKRRHIFDMSFVWTTKVIQAFLSPDMSI